jgi:hypothetical protein
MQGTVVMLIALSGLGCHHKSCDVAYAPPSYSCFSSGCYANVYPQGYVSPSSYSGCYSSCYSGCYSGCYGGGCYGGCYSGGYGGHHGCGLFAKLFSCCGGGRSSWYGYDDTFVGGGYDLPYDPPIFGYALQYNYGSADQSQSTTVPPSATPSEAAPPVPPNPVPTTPKPPTPTPETAPVTPPTPPAPVEIPAPKPTT